MRWARLIAFLGSPNDGRYGSKGHDLTIREILVQHLVDLSYAVGLQLVFQEGRSCWGRIRHGWRTRCDPLLWQEVKARVPQIAFDDYGNQNENSLCSAGTQALIEKRPWMSLADIELFLQGWFQAQRCLCRTANIEHQTTASSELASQSPTFYAAHSSSAIDHT